MRKYCQKWIHRWCIGVHKQDYPILSNSSDSWTCPSCGLKDMVNLPLVNTVETLKGEVASLLISNLAIALLKKTTSPLSMKL